MDVVEALMPLLRITQLCNLWQWHLDGATRLLQRSRLLELYSLSVVTISLGYLLYGLINESRIADHAGSETSHIGHTVDSIQLVGIRVAHITALLEALWQRQAQRQFLATIREIDRDFASLLQLDVDNGRLRQQMTRRGLWMLAGYMISQGFIFCTKMFGSDEHFTLYWVSYLLPLLVCGLRYFQIYTAVQMVHQRLAMLLQLLEALQLNHATDPQKPYACMCIKEALQLQVAAAACMQRLISARRLYQRLWLLVGLLNRCYGLSMLINLGNDFLSITSNCYWIFLNFRQFAASPADFLQMLGSALWTTPHLGNVLTLALMCDRTAYYTTRLALSLHHIRVDLQNDGHNALITQFSLQLLHQRLSFSAAGFFNVDCTLLYTIVGATTTYLIILIQFHMSEISFSTASAGG